ncbi:MAG TPA: ferric reductase-like transmembrane domain-containing protein [Candidatus Saccharimonadales bacterium]|nr:ferric reductase-like transmembrane domain-containing protein [Candidatus Saccharimonadales bacterium]
MFSKQTVQNLPNNSRFYILVSTLLISLLTLCIARTQIMNGQLFYIRLEQAYGVISIAFLYAALLISPLSKLFAGRTWMPHVLFARRAIGVSAAYFAVLHAAVAFWGQTGGWAGIQLLPQTFVWSLGMGAVALCVLLLMAATSFDKVIRFMTFRRWKWLHRLIYAGGILIILHVWMIGSLLVFDAVRAGAFLLLTVFFALESWRTVVAAVKKYPELQRRDYIVVLTVSLWAFWTVLLVSLPALVQNYHDARHGEEHGHVE